MFGGFGRGRAKYNEVQKDQTLPKVEVTEEEFVKLLVEQGTAGTEAAMQARIARIMGSSVKIGSRLVSVKSCEEDNAAKKVVDDTKALLKRHGLA